MLPIFTIKNAQCSILNVQISITTFACPALGGNLQIYNAKTGVTNYDVFKNKTGMGAVIDVYRAGFWLSHGPEHDRYDDPFQDNRVKRIRNKRSFKLGLFKSGPVDFCKRDAAHPVSFFICYTLFPLCLFL
jgi:hypothetical protein